LDARKLRSQPEFYKPSFYDLVLLPGPLYHILDDEQRADVLLTAFEMIKPGGFVLAAFVSRNAHLRDVASRDPERLEKEWEFYEQYLRDGGKYTRGSNAPMIHSTVDEIRRVIDTTKQLAREEDIDMELTKLISCEGFLGFRHAEALAELGGDAFAKWLAVVLRTAEDETNLGAADHVLAILKRSS
jgi:S-adenosylmethionine-dependent methyltransferase